ncbi:leucine-rich repeat protein [Perkinsela sp. CCAP 1560/4]|nr:leucine-rich repeat protein [Perkinsela sp. CCAP 1560/4]|eukprot:KNH04555.1 leucine-rich repeat protein [Perkinsela sp. CCAP 1560/4]
MQIQMFAAFFIACDDGIGRVDRSTIPQQTLMELFVFGLNDPEKICGNREDPNDVCEWEGVKCNVDGEVENFEWVFNQADGTGTIGFEFLPCSMKTLHMFMNALSGTIQLPDRPGKIEAVNLDVNQLTGSLNLDRLPAAVRSLYLYINKFTGEISLGNLPQGLEILALEDNELTANPTKGHLSVVGWTSTPSWGKPRAFETLVVFLSWRRPY